MAINSQLSQFFFIILKMLRCSHLERWDAWHRTIVYETYIELNEKSLMEQLLRQIVVRFQVIRQQSSISVDSFCSEKF